MDLKDFVNRIELSRNTIKYNIYDIAFGWEIPHKDTDNGIIIRIENEVEERSHIVDEDIQTAIKDATFNRMMRCLDDDDIIRKFKTITQNMKNILNRNIADVLSYDDMLEICAYISSLKRFTNRDTIVRFFKRDPIKDEADNIVEIIRVMFCSFVINVLSQLELNNIYNIFENNKKASLFYMVVYRCILDFLKDAPHITRTVMDKYELILLLVESQVVRMLNIYNMPGYIFLEDHIEDSKYTKIHSLIQKGC